MRSEIDSIDIPGSAEAYSRAERFLFWNQDAHLLNAHLRHCWVGDRDSFWYVRTVTPGETEFILVDASTGKSGPAFDHEKVARLLSKATGRVCKAGRLPFSAFRYVTANTAIQFEHGGNLWTCDTQAETCWAEALLAPANEILSPDGEWAAFVRDHNLWVRSMASGTEHALTTDGCEHWSYAGSPGYSTRAVTEARFGVKPAPQVIWSPDSRLLLTHRIDERRVGDFFLLQSMPEDGTVRPKLFSYRYALPGDENVPLLEPLVVSVLERRIVRLAPEPLVCSVQSMVEKKDTWWSSDGAAVYYLDRGRFSREVTLYKADPLIGRRTAIIRETSPAVVLTNDSNIFLPPFARTLSNGDVIWYSQRDGWGHLYYYRADGSLRNSITRGEWPVRDVVRVDENRQTLFFAASGREPGRDPYEQRLYSVRFDGGQLSLLTPEEADHQWPHVAMGAPRWQGMAGSDFGRFSPSGKFFLDTHSRPDVPPAHVLRTSEGGLVKYLGQADASKLQERGYVAVLPFVVLAADGQTPLYGNLYRPSHFDPAKKYPVIDAVYPGPQVERTSRNFVGANFGVFLDAQCLAELGFIVVTLDGRGTPHRSRAFHEYSYGRLDKASDFEDHIAGLRQLAERHPYMDLSRVGADGASGGGFAAARAVLAYPDFYKVAVAAAGNHDQRGNLAPWAETYIGPLDEAQYLLSSTIPLAGRLKGKLLLMHGEMDDNVHPSLTLKLADALIRENKDFDLLLIPNGDHSAYCMSTYFIRRKWDYFVRHLLGKEPPREYCIRPAPHE